MSVPAGSDEPTNKQQVATGFFVSDAGFLVTAYHAIEGLPNIRVIMSPRQVLTARTVKFDKEADLALLKVEAITPFLYLSHSNAVPAGMDVITMGYPQVNVLGITIKITRGIVNSGRGMRDDPNSFQFSAEVQKGNSGGPLVGPGGMVVGVVRSKLDAIKMSEATSDLPQNVNFATKSSVLIKFLADTPGIPSTRRLNPRAQIDPVQLYDELRTAIVPIVSDDK
ncbi:trypsin-like peptidase domain-containing protein [Shewanella sp.]|uniref:trypsin-like peptidase domain-containing protein n=1 Tax=Shewanella sp. TaxID=50422 RepID=UPI0040488BBA